MDRTRKPGAGWLWVPLVVAVMASPASAQMHPGGPMGMHGMMMHPSPPPANAPAALDRFGCMGCHAIVRKGLGPAFVAVARRYQRQVRAEARLAAFIEHGGHGHWPGTMPDLDVPHADADALARWILALPSSAQADASDKH